MRAWFCCYQVTLLTPACHVSDMPPCPFPPSHFPAGWPQPGQGMQGLCPYRCRALHLLFLACMRIPSAHVSSFLGAPEWWPWTPAYLPLLQTRWGPKTCRRHVSSPFHIANENNEWHWLQQWSLRMVLVNSCQLHWGPLMMLSQFSTHL